jgi:hypothetical protein
MKKLEMRAKHQDLDSRSSGNQLEDELSESVRLLEFGRVFEIEREMRVMGTLIAKYSKGVMQFLEVLRENEPSKNLSRQIP